MTVLSGRVADCIDLIEFVDDNIDVEEARAVANRIGVQRKVKYRDTSTGRERWEAVLEAALNDRCIDSFLREIGELIGEAQRPDFEKAKRACAEGSV